MNFVQFFRKKMLGSRWIEVPELADDTLVQSSQQADQGLVMGMRLAVLEDQVAVILAADRLVGFFVPGAYTLEAAKMPGLTADPKYDWLYPAEVLFLNLRPFKVQSWTPAKPVLARDPDFGLVQLAVNGMYEAQITDTALFVQEIIIKRGWREWSFIDQWLSGRLSELIISLTARQQLQLARLGKYKERVCQIMLQELQQEFKAVGVTINSLDMQQFELHSTVRNLLQKRPCLQADIAAYNRAIMRSLLG